MNYKSDLQKFITSHYIYSGVRIALAIVIPAIFLAQIGLLRECFLFPLGTSFVGLTDQPGPFVRRRNAFILAVFSFVLVAFTASLLKDCQVLVCLEIIVFALFFSLIGVYGTRLESVGSISLLVLGIFIDGHLVGQNIFKSLLMFLAGCLWFVFIFLIVSRIQPYKMIGQMIGENYLELAAFLRIKAQFYKRNPDYDKLFQQVIYKQIDIKKYQENTRETVFRTRTIVNEATTTSRLMMMLFLNSIDLHEKLMTSENDYRSMQEYFGDKGILQDIKDYLMILANEITNIGIALQSGSKPKHSVDLDAELHKMYESYYELRMKEMNAHNLENFMILRQILMRINELTEKVNSVFTIYNQNLKLAKSLSTGLDYRKFLPKEEKLNLKVLKNNISLRSFHFRHAIRISVALLLGYMVSRMKFLGIGHSYWIIIAIVAILKPAYSITKSRNLLRLSGTLVGGIVAYVVLMFVGNATIQLVILLLSMIMYYTLLKSNYFWAVFFMTVYLFLAFNFMNSGSVDIIFKDRIIDTAIAGVIAFLVSYLVLPVWEQARNIDFIKTSLKNNTEYLKVVFDKFSGENISEEQYKIKRKDAIVSLANLSDSFQRMLSDPKGRKEKQKAVHQFVATSHLITAYTASLSQYNRKSKDYPEIDVEVWRKKILAELETTRVLLENQKVNIQQYDESNLTPEDAVNTLINKRKEELEENEFTDRRDINRITRLTELKNIRELFKLIYNTAKEQRKVVEAYYRETSPQ